jgi:acyl carrier protein
MDEIIKDVIVFLKSQGFLKENISLHENDSLTKTGVIDSIIMLELVEFLENKYKIEIPIKMLTSQNFDTLATIRQSVMKLKQ